MRRMLIYFGCIVIFVFGSFYGCKSIEEPITTDTTGVRTEGVESINSIICTKSSLRRMAETENGYYAQFLNTLFYADKSNMSNWVPVCNMPECEHQDDTCPANVGETFFVEGDKIYTLRNTESFDLESDHCRNGIFSMALDGTHLQMETEIQCNASMHGGSNYTTLLSPTMACGCYSYLQSDGLYLNQLLLTIGGETKVLCESTTEEKITTSLVGTFSLRGDWVAASEMRSGADHFLDYLYRIENGELVEVAGLRKFDLSGAYLDGDILYHTGDDGYYVTNLSTGESEKRADTQLESSSAYHLSPSYIVESNIIDNFMPENPEIEIYDGTQWKSVILSEELAHEGFPYCFPYAMSTEYIFFIGEKQIQQEYMQLLYCVSLTDESCTLYPCGEFEALK